MKARAPTYLLYRWGMRHTHGSARKGAQRSAALWAAGTAAQDFQACLTPTEINSNLHQVSHVVGLRMSCCHRRCAAPSELYSSALLTSMDSCRRQQSLLMTPLDILPWKFCCQVMTDETPPRLMVSRSDYHRRNFTVTLDSHFPHSSCWPRIQFPFI